MTAGNTQLIQQQMQLTAMSNDEPNAVNPIIGKGVCTIPEDEAEDLTLTPMQRKTKKIDDENITIVN